ncbi:hypothetical protein CL652_00780 [bacterium]|mgnify:CR=1 FL=1|nr:hypothetical protein [bacterium]|tara:strand:- start:3844 stop:4245 length:402 start_codon:yes stop_codon:yes gene_type:complete
MILSSKRCNEELNEVNKMQTAIATLAGLVLVAGTLLKLMLFFRGLGALGRFILPFLYKERKERLGWFELWGGWNLVVFALLAKFASDKVSAEMEAYEKVAFQLEGLRILGTYLVLPILVSFLISRVHIYVREL